MPRVLEEPAWRKEHGRATSRKHHRLDFQALGIAEQHVVKRRDARCAGLHGARKMQCVASPKRTCGIEDQPRGAVKISRGQREQSATLRRLARFRQATALAVMIRGTAASSVRV